MRFPRNKITLVVGGIAGLALFSMLPSSADAQTKPAECYRYDTQDTPFASDEAIARKEVWCYRPLENPAGATMVYNVDDEGQTTPELSAIVEADGTVTHGSLLAGVLSVHKVRSTFNPLPVPLTPPPGAERVPEPITPTSVGSSDKSLKVLTTETVRSNDIAVRLEGTYSMHVAPEALPWRGYWFPYSSSRMHKGKDSPLAKFDRFVQARTGKNPGAQAWERRRHAPAEAKWSGHCNGWAATSILRPEPKKPWTDPLSGTTFSVADLKGVLIERDWCPKIAFFGRRFRGPGGNPRDINPALFHNTMTYYIGQLKKPLLVDYMASAPVENRVISGYDMKITRTGRNTYRVEAVTKIHEYDLKMINEPGVAPHIIKNYKYNITTDEHGNVVKGSWISANPDFLWVPLSPGKCNDGNLAVSENWVKQLGQPIPLPW